MAAYLCTYRHYWPTTAEKRSTIDNSKNNPLLQEFLKSYDESFFDWGDDPSFFSALRRLKDVNRASWGVCRQDVRGTLAEGDLVVFFCARQNKIQSCWDYYFVGYGTVKNIIDRKKLWTESAYKPYREFYNVLAHLDGGTLVQHEYFHPYHNSDCERRWAAPYIIFNPKLSMFNVMSPHQVATWKKGDRPPEVWNNDRRSRKLEGLLFEDRGIGRRLRTSTTGYAHSKLNLTSHGRLTRPGLGVEVLREALKRLVGS